MKKKIVRYVLFAIGILLSFYVLYTYLYTGNFSFGHFMMACLSAFLIVWSFVYKIIKEKATWINFIILGLLAIFFSYLLFIGIYGSIPTTKYKDKAVIVLGAGLRGTTPSRQLAMRLNAAAEYYAKNPDAVIIVSGGKGEDEIISEASAMQTYLIAKGIPESSIIKEEKSTSTETNFKCSKEILDELFGETYDICYITNDFHVFRAGFFARETGFNGKITHLGAKHSALFTLIDFSREFAGIINYALTRLDIIS